MNGVKSYANSYLYTRVPNYERSILEYVMKAERINKQSESFSTIINDVKRRQSTAVLSRVLMRNDVVLCIYNKPLPAAFKVFACKDVKNDGAVKVFIDCSGLITLNNGFFTCNKIDTICTYLVSAMMMIIYNSETMRLTNNSSIIQYGTECFVALASHIFDYLRLNGYAENRNKIAYILAMYFQVNLLGLERSDTSVKNLAAKVSGINSRDINAMEIYYDDEDLINIDTAIKSLADTFKMKNNKGIITTDTFVEKWIWFYGTGTQFGCELFTAFSTMISDAYCGSYVNNQKTIEKCCGRSMVNYTEALLRVGSNTLDNGFKYESSLDRDSYNSNKTVVQEVLFNRRISKEMQIKVEDFYDEDVLKKKIKVLGEEGFGNNTKKRSQNMYMIWMSGAAEANKYLLGRQKDYPGIGSTIISAIKPYLTETDKKKICDGLSSGIVNMTKMLDGHDKRINLNECKKVIADNKKALKMLDPDNAILKEASIKEDSSLPKFGNRKISADLNVVKAEAEENENILDAKNILKDKLKDIVTVYNRDQSNRSKIRKEIDRMIEMNPDDDFDGFDKNRNVPKLGYSVYEDNQDSIIFLIYDGSQSIRIALSKTINSIAEDLAKDRAIKDLPALHTITTGDGDEGCIYVDFKK